MKKLIALLLVLVMLVPMALVANADADFTEKPFYALGWDEFDEKAYPYLDGLVHTRFSVIGDKVRIMYGGTTMLMGSYTDEDVTELATKLKATMDARPEGTRYWHLANPSVAYDMGPKNVIFLDFGVDQMKELVTAIMKKYKELGGKLDGCVVDTEYLPLSTHYLCNDTKYNPNNAAKNPMIFKQIVSNPQYATEVRPLLEERGFPFWKNVTDYTPEIYSIHPSLGDVYKEARSIWDTVMRNRLSQYINEWVYEPMKTYFPEANLSDYQSIDSKPWMKMAAVTDGGETLSGGSSIKAGDTSSYSYYYARPGKTFFEQQQKYAGTNSALFEKTPFNLLTYDINFTRHMYESTDTKKIAPWITSYVYDGKVEGSIAYTPYYTELLYHLASFAPEPFLSYTWSPEYSDTNDGKQNYTSPRWIMTCEVMNSVLEALTKVAGYSDRTPIPTPMNWNSKFMLTGMYTGGRNLWRITPDTDVVSVADFKVEGTDPTFRVAGQTVTFPGGKIVAEADIKTAGSCGYWVETAKGVNPVITNDADRYDKYPSLLMDFEDVAEGKFDYNTSTPKKAWEFTWKNGGTTTVKTVNGNKVMALNGTAEMRSINLPGNVTAGDSYAEDQAWAITVTVPEGLSADAEIVLLNYTGAKTKADDGGFQIKGGKLSYSENGEYKELMDIAAGTYTLKRVMDFHDGKAFSTYFVYDAAGKELKASAKVAVPAFTSITNIKFATVGADKEVLIDNYKLSLTGTAADFSLYDAKSGMPTEDTGARAASTAYRLSWLNATAKEETATIVAEIYEGTTLKETKTIKEIKLAPGCDGAETGVVDVAEGQSVKVYVKTDVKVDVITAAKTPAAPSDPTTDPTADPSAPSETAPADDGKKSDNTMLIVVIAVAVVAVVGVVLALVLTKKKPEAKPEEKAEDKAEEEKTEE